MKNKLQTEHKIGIIAIICILIGIIIAFVYMYINGNTIYIMQKNDNAIVNSNKNKNYYKTDSLKTYPKTKHYNIYNYYYEKGNNQPQQTILETDSLVSTNNKKYNIYHKNKQENIVIDLNTCDTLDLQMIKGIGSVFSMRIYKYRERLGGYTSINQLKEVYGINDSLYKNIEKHFTISTNNIKKININSKNIKEIASHPYIDYYLAKEIIIFHNNYGEYTDIDQLKNIHLMDDSTFHKIEPYIDIK